MNLTKRRNYLKKLYSPIGVGLAKLHISPNVITLLATIFGCFSAYFFYIHKPLTAATLLLISGILDLSDGTVARLNDRASKFGAVFDWIADKLVDGFIIGSIGFAYGSPFIAMSAIVFNMLHTFIKPVAYAEIGFSERNKGKIDDPLEGVGFYGRPETHITIVIFSILERLNPEIGLHLGIRVIVILTFLSLSLRILYLLKKYGKDYE